MNILFLFNYCTEINVTNFLLNIYNFHRNFRFIFSLVLSENAPNVHFREAKFKNFPGDMPPDPPSPTLNCFAGPVYA